MLTKTINSNFNIIRILTSQRQVQSLKRSTFPFKRWAYDQRTLRKRCAHAKRNVVNANEQWTMSVRKAQTERKVNSERKMNDLFVKQVIARIILLLCSGLYLSTACTPTFIIKFKVIGLNSTKSILSVIETLCYQRQRHWSNILKYIFLWNMGYFARTYCIIFKNLKSRPSKSFSFCSVEYHL